MKVKFTFLAIIITTICFGQISMDRLDEGILIKEGDSDVLFYQIDQKSIDGKYLRNNYIHPLWGIDGNILTEDSPADHPHQRGIFWAWHQILIDDESIGDGWELTDFIQDISEVEFLVNKKDQGLLNTTVYWYSPMWGNGKAPYIRENTSIIVHPKHKKQRRIDFEIRLLALEEGITLGGSDDEKGYGGFSARFNLPEGVQFSGEDGRVQSQTNAVNAGPYMNFSGAFSKKSKKGGIVIFENPQNSGAPNPWILREKESMQNIAWPGSEPVEISKEIPLVLNYTMFIYQGNFKVRNIEKLLN